MKDAAEFPPSKRKANGRSSWCRACTNAARLTPEQRARTRARYRDDLEKRARLQEGKRRYRATDAGRAAVAAYNRRYAASTDGAAVIMAARQRRVESGRAAADTRRYLRTPGGKAKMRVRHERYRTSPKGRLAHTAATSRYAIRHPDKRRAQAAVQIALRTGALQRPSQCEQCQREAKPHAHHHRGYDRAHWLDVQWICARCHRAEHQKLASFVPRGCRK